MARVSWLVAALFLAGLLIPSYGPACHGDFIWDDDLYVIKNQTLRSAAGLCRIWLEPGATPQYYPLVFTTFWFEFQQWGLWPAGYHWDNVLLHGLNALLLWRVLLCLQVPGALLAAAVFAVHPVNVESVAWITERKNVLAGFFFFASLLAYLRFDPLGDGAFLRRSRTWYALALTLFLCALASKTITCSLPAVLLLLVWWKRGRIRLGDALPTVPFFVAGVAAAAVTVLMERHHVGAVGADWDLSAVQRGLIAGRALWFYAWKLAWPFDLSFMYPRWSIDPARAWQYLLPLAAIGVAAWAWCMRRRWGRGPLVAFLYFGGNLLPALGFINIFPMRYSFVADHFQYLASAGMIALFAAATTSLFGGRAADASHAPAPRPRFGPKGGIGLSLAGVLVVALAFLTYRQGAVYRNLETLWRDTLAKNPDCWMAHLNLGGLLIEHGHRDEGLEHIRRTLELRPHSAEAYNFWGIALLTQKSFAAAAEKHLKAIELSPDPAFFFNLGMARWNMGDREDALAALQEAVRVSPGFAMAHAFLGRCLLEMGKPDEAREHLQKGQETQP